MEIRNTELETIVEEVLNTRALEQETTVLITPKECSKYLGVGIDAVRRMMTESDFPMIWIGTQAKIVKDNLMIFLEKHNKQNFGL